MAPWMWVLDGIVFVAGLLMMRHAARLLWFDLCDAIREAIEAPGFVNEDLTYWDPGRSMGRAMGSMMNGFEKVFAAMAQPFMLIGKGVSDVRPGRVVELTEHATFVPPTLYVCAEVLPLIEEIKGYGFQVEARPCQARECSFREGEEWCLNEQDRAYFDALGGREDSARTS